MKFYKYFGAEKIDRDLETLVGGQLWFSTPDKLNDPCETRFLIDIPFVNLMEGRALIKNFSKSEFEIYLQAEHRKSGICSFSRYCDKMLMWSHYADGHSGFALEVEIDHLDYSTIRKVQYTEDIVKIDKNTISTDKILDSILLTKGLDWKYEDEWRSIIKTGHTKMGCRQIAFERIIFGSKMSSDHKDMIRKKFGTTISYAQAEVHPTKYSIVISEEAL